MALSLVTLGFGSFGSVNRLPTLGLYTAIVATPVAPSDLTAVAVSSTQIDLAWTDNSEDVAGVNEVQDVTNDGTLVGGSFKLTYDGETTSAISYNATASEVQAALEATAAFEVGDVSVSAITGGYRLTFTGGLGAMNVPLVEIASGVDYTVSRLNLPSITVLQAGDESTPHIVRFDYSVAPSSGTVVLSRTGGSVNGELSSFATGNNWASTASDVAETLSYTCTSDNGLSFTIEATTNGLGPTFEVAAKVGDPIARASYGSVNGVTEGSPRQWTELGFEVHRSTDGSSYSLLVDLGANLESWPDETCSPSTQYWYKVKAYNEGGYSAFTSAVTATTPSAGGGVGSNWVSTRVGVNWTCFVQSNCKYGEN